MIIVSFTNADSDDDEGGCILYKKTKDKPDATSRKKIFKSTMFIIREINIQLMATDAIYQFNLMMHFNQFGRRTGSSDKSQHFLGVVRDLKRFSACEQKFFVRFVFQFVEQKLKSSSIKANWNCFFFVELSCFD